LKRLISMGMEAPKGRSRRSGTSRKSQVVGCKAVCVQVALHQVATMIDLHLTRPALTPVVFDRVQDLPAVAVKELRRNELPLVILHSDVPQQLANIGVLNDWGVRGILTTGVLIDWVIWGVLNGQARWAVLLSLRRDRRSNTGRKRAQNDLQLPLGFCQQIFTVPVNPFFFCAMPTPF
jgi:hypothetical protein